MKHTVQPKNIVQAWGGKDALTSMITTANANGLVAEAMKKAAQNA
jgi:hypothetical protein